MLARLPEQWRSRPVIGMIKETTFIFRCLVCGWKCRIAAGDIEAARRKAYALHRHETRVGHDSDAEIFTVKIFG